MARLPRDSLKALGKVAHRGSLFWVGEPWGSSGKPHFFGSRGLPTDRTLPPSRLLGTGCLSDSLNRSGLAKQTKQGTKQCPNGKAASMGPVGNAAAFHADHGRGSEAGEAVEGLLHKPDAQVKQRRDS